MNTAEKIFKMMREDRKYSAGFISHRLSIPISCVRDAFRRLVRGGAVEAVQSSADKRRRLYISKQKSFFRLWRD